MFDADAFPATLPARARIRVGLPLVLSALLTAHARAQAPDEPPVYGCGKAQALAARYLAESHEPLEPGVREAMAETDVLHYDLDIEVSNLDPINDTCTITGTNVMTIQSKSASLTQFTFRLRSQYSITGALINGGTPVSVNAPSTTTRVATLDRAYGMDEVFTLTIAYAGSSVSRGFGSIEVATQGGTQVVATLSEAYYAYTWWPCKDGDTFLPGDNSDKATLEFSITAPNDFVVPSNGLLQSVETLSGNRKRYNWATNYPIATYLVSFAATNYNTWTADYTHPGGTMPVEFYIYPSNDTPANRTAWERVIDMIAAYRDVYGEYPFIEEKYGLYNFPFGGGMEHQTMTGQSGFGESLSAHELAHQWWGDMVTCKTWSDIWLNEGFATFSECIWEERKLGTPSLSAYLAAVQARRPGSVGDSVYVPAAQTNDMNRIFSYTYSYLKASWVLHQLRGVVGDTAFFDILADYRSAYQFSAATTDDFAASAAASYGQDLTWFFDEWVYQIGAPAYQYGWQSVAVAGQSYLLVRIAQTHTTPGYPNVFIMPVDLRVTIAGSPQTVTVWNDARTEWFVLPVSGAVTAVSFDPEQWILRTAATSAAYVPGPPKIVAVSPAPGAIISEASSPSQLTITFHTNVNASAASFSLVGAGTGAKAFTLVSGSNVNPVVLSLSEPLPADDYTLTVTDNVTAVNSGMALDGETADPADAASLPSGDGVAGGAAVIQFTVAGPVPGDIDGDGDVDLDDYVMLADCMTGPGGGILPGCDNADLDVDVDADLADFAIWERLTHP